MKTVAIIDGQNLLDIAISHHGTVAAIFDMVAANGMEVSADLVAGQELVINDQQVYQDNYTPDFVSIAKPGKASIISDGQNLLDVVLQEVGSIEGLFDLAMLNKLELTHGLTPGQVLNVTEAIIQKSEVVSYYSSRNHRINTGTSELITAPAGAMTEHNEAEYNEAEHN